MTFPPTRHGPPGAGDGAVPRGSGGGVTIHACAGDAASIWPRATAAGWIAPLMYGAHRCLIYGPDKMPVNGCLSSVGSSASSWQSRLPPQSSARASPGTLQ
jgi:hypothetical protein